MSNIPQTESPNIGYKIAFSCFYYTKKRCASVALFGAKTLVTDVTFLTVLPHLYHLEIKFLFTRVSVLAFHKWFPYKE